MRRASPPAVTSSLRGSPSRVNIYPRLLMICGAILVAYGVIAPAGILLRSAMQSSDATAPTATRVATSRAPAIQAAAPKAAPSKAIPSKAVPIKAPQIGPVERMHRQEILSLYEAWKDAWSTRDIEAIMKLYSPQVRFRNMGRGATGYIGTRQTLLMLWGQNGFKVQDKVPPSLSLKGERAILIAGQAYRGLGPDRDGIDLTHRFVLKREDIGGIGATKSSIVPSQKRTTSRTSRQWRIVESDFLPYQGNDDSRGQIF